MARARGVYRRGDSPYWWIDVVLPDGGRIRQSAKTENRQEAVALVAKFKTEAFKQSAFGIKQRRSWQEAVVRYLALKANLRSIEDVRRICRKLDPVLGNLMLDQINGDRSGAEYSYDAAHRCRTNDRERVTCRRAGGWLPERGSGISRPEPS